MQHLFFGRCFVLVELVLIPRPIDPNHNITRLESEHNQKQQKKAAYLWWTADRRTKRYGGTGIRARVERITTANANHYTIPPRYDTVHVSECTERGGGEPLTCFLLSTAGFEYETVRNLLIQLL
jgi:hypothetical protein